MRKLMSTFVLSTALYACSDSDNRKNTDDLDQFEAVRVAALAELKTNSKSPAVSVAIYQNGEVVFAEGFGVKSLKGSQTATKDTLFQLGSVTKMFTALGTLKLVDEGMIELDDKLVDTLPDMTYPAWQAQSWQDISIHHLLSHQSGLYDNYEDSTVTQPLTLGMQEYHGASTILMNPPGHFYNYSNPNFSYAGAIVEQYTQTEYKTWMKANVFEPLGMENTFMTASDAENYGDYALGVYENGNQTVAVQSIEDIPSYDLVVPAGAYTWSTASDLLKMSTFLFDGNQDVLDTQTQALMTTPHINEDTESHYGYGIVIDSGFELDDEWHDQLVWSHRGFNGAYTASFIMLPEQDIAIAVLNSGGGDFSDTMIAALKSVADLSQTSVPPEDVEDTASLSKHTGTYTDYASGITFEIGLDGNNLTIDAPALDEAGESYSKTMQYLNYGVYYATVSGVPYLFRFIAEEEGGESVYMASRYAVGIKHGYTPWSETQY